MRYKNSITLYLYTNATDYSKASIIMKLNSSDPQCFVDKVRNLGHYNNNKSWCNGNTFLDFSEICCCNIFFRDNIKFIFILDNCVPHGAEPVDPLGQVIFFLISKLHKYFSDHGCRYYL